MGTHGSDFRRTESVQLREVEALRLRATGLTLQQVAEATGYATRSSAKRAIDRILADVKFDAVDQYRQLELTRLEAAMAKVTEVLYGRHVLVNDGRIVRDDDGNALADHGPNLAAARELRQLSARISALLGLDAPSRRIVEVITEDVIDAELRALEAEMAALDNADASV